LKCVERKTKLVPEVNRGLARQSRSAQPTSNDECFRHILLRNSS